jgi:hypothetical protein
VGMLTRVITRVSRGKSLILWGLWEAGRRFYPGKVEGAAGLLVCREGNRGGWGYTRQQASPDQGDSRVYAAFGAS